jgi:hypothetical protein
VGAAVEAVAVAVVVVVSTDLVNMVPQEVTLIVDAVTTV